MRKILTVCYSVLSAAMMAALNLPSVTVIPPGQFVMGSEEVNESPAHIVTITRPFALGVTEVTNAQFEEFFPGHCALRGKDGISTADDEPVVNITYAEAAAYCDSLSRATGRHFRLPTEAEWEYACRAGTTTPYWTGDTLPAEFLRNQTITRDYQPVDLTVGRTPANPFGLHGMHGGVEELCADFYAPYSRKAQRNPQGASGGEYRVTRGGSHNTPVEYLRSSWRGAILPSDRNSLVGFRVAEDLMYEWPQPQAEPFFRDPIPFVVAPDPTSGEPFYSHNHQPAIIWTDYGELLAIWFSANQENSRVMSVLSSRLTPVDSVWPPATAFLTIPGRNLTGSSLINNGRGTIYHFNGIEAAGDWQNLALAVRQSNDGGLTWSELKLIEPEHRRRHQAIAGPIQLKDGTIVQLCDAGPGGNDGTSVHLFNPADTSSFDPFDGSPLPDFAEGNNGTTIAGIHAGVVELADGTLMALARGNSIADKNGRLRMPMSLSVDSGRTWTYHASEFPPIDGGQRLVLMRLREGPLLLVSFTDHPERTPEAERGMEFANGRGYGMYAALSFDEGRTWPVRKLITDGRARTLSGGAWTGEFTADAHHAEPKGYLAATQTPDGTIHLLSSALHYRFNLPWLLQQVAG